MTVAVEASVIVVMSVGSTSCNDFNYKNSNSITVTVTVTDVIVSITVNVCDSSSAEGCSNCIIVAVAL